MSGYETPAQQRVVVQADQLGLLARGSAYEPSDWPVDRFDPGGAPRTEPRVAEAQRGTVKRTRRVACAGLAGAGNDPDVLDSSAAEDLAEVQLVDGVGLLDCGRAIPVDAPRPDEPAERL
jgi:hypothetical protein